jgi:hypothetical protein
VTGVVRAARHGLWLLVAWAVLLLLATLTHHPDYRSHFADWSRYVTSAEFLTSHLAGSIAGAGLGALGFMALSIVLASHGALRLSIWALATFVLGDVAVVAVFGVAAFAQPAIGRAYLAGDHQVAALYDDVNGTPLFATDGPGVLLLSAGLVLYGVGVLRTRLVGRPAGWALIIGGPLFALVGVILADVVQSVGALLLLAGTIMIALRASVGSQGASLDVSPTANTTDR